MMSDPKIDPERMKQWEENVLPVPSAERLKGKVSPPSTCSTRRVFEQWIKSPPYEKSAERYSDDCEKYSLAGSYKDICTDLAWHAFKAAYKHSELQMSRVRMGLSKLSRSEHANTRDHAKRLLTLFQEPNALAHTRTN